MEREIRPPKRRPNKPGATICLNRVRDASCPDMLEGTRFTSRTELMHSDQRKLSPTLMMLTHMSLGAFLSLGNIRRGEVEMRVGKGSATSAWRCATRPRRGAGRDVIPRPARGPDQPARCLAAHAPSATRSLPQKVSCLEMDIMLCNPGIDREGPMQISRYLASSLTMIHFQ